MHSALYSLCVWWQVTVTGMGDHFAIYLKTATKRVLKSCCCLYLYFIWNHQWSESERFKSEWGEVQSQRISKTLVYILYKCQSQMPRCYSERVYILPQTPTQSSQAFKTICEHLHFTWKYRNLFYNWSCLFILFQTM